MLYRGSLLVDFVFIFFREFPVTFVYQFLLFFFIIENQFLLPVWFRAKLFYDIGGQTTDRRPTGSNDNLLTTRVRCAVEIKFETYIHSFGLCAYCVQLNDRGCTETVVRDRTNAKRFAHWRSEQRLWWQHAVASRSWTFSRAQRVQEKSTISKYLNTKGLPRTGVVVFYPWNTNIGP